MFVMDEKIKSKKQFDSHESLFLFVFPKTMLNCSPHVLYLPLFLLIFQHD